MSRLALFIFACAFLVSITFASPLPTALAGGELVQLEKRATHVGRGTWYYPGLGNCGGTNTQADFILAISKQLYDQNSGSNCGQWVSIEGNGNTAYGLTVDSCESCTPNDIDMSPALFKKFASLSTGQIEVTWHFMSESWEP